MEAIWLSHAVDHFINPTAPADYYGLDEPHPSIQAALLHYGVSDLNEDCLQAAETILEEAAFNRWPSVPVRGFGGGNLRMGPFVAELPDAANDESMKFTQLMPT